MIINLISFIKYKIVFKNYMYYITKLGMLNRAQYKKKISETLIDGGIENKDYSQIPVIENYNDYLKIFEYPLEIKESWNKNIHLKAEIKLIDALMGKKIQIYYRQIVKCSDCTSTIKSTDKKCLACDSTGLTKKENIQVICDSCRGYGFHKTEKCPVCSNNFVYKKKNKVELSLDKDFYEGCIFSYSQKGNYDIFSNSYGFLKIKPVIISDESEDGIKLNVINGSQVESEEKLNLTTMVLGGTHNVTHALGKCQVIIEPGTQPNDYKIINNIGIPNYFDKVEYEMHKGNQIVYWKLKIPSKEKIEQNSTIKELFKELSKYDDLDELDKLNKCDINI